MGFRYNKQICRQNYADPIKSHEVEFNKRSGVDKKTFIRPVTVKPSTRHLLSAKDLLFLESIGLNIVENKK